MEEPLLPVSAKFARTDISRAQAWGEGGGCLRPSNGSLLDTKTFLKPKGSNNSFYRRRQLPGRHLVSYKDGILIIGTCSCIWSGRFPSRDPPTIAGRYRNLNPMRTRLDALVPGPMSRLSSLGGCQALKPLHISLLYP